MEKISHDALEDINHGVGMQKTHRLHTRKENPDGSQRFLWYAQIKISVAMRRSNENKQRRDEHVEYEWKACVPLEELSKTQSGWEKT